MLTMQMLQNIIMRHNLTANIMAHNNKVNLHHKDIIIQIINLIIIQEDISKLNLNNNRLTQIQLRLVLIQLVHYQIQVKLLHLLQHLRQLKQLHLHLVIYTLPVNVLGMFMTELEVALVVLGVMLITGLTLHNQPVIR